MGCLAPKVGAPKVDAPKFEVIPATRHRHFPSSLSMLYRSASSITTMTSTCRSFSLKEKRDAVRSIEFMIQNGYSKSMSCRSIGIPILTTNAGVKS